jgi:hypothetical protein
VPRWTDWIPAFAGMTDRVALSIFIAGICLTAEAAHACRCAERPLDAYVAEAQVLFFGRVSAVEHESGNGGYQAVRFAVDGSPFKGTIEGLAFATASSTASCGVPVQVGERYLIFASRQAATDSVAWFNTCNGTRLFENRAGGIVRGFIDAEPKEALRRLAGIRKFLASSPSADPRTSATPRLPRFGDPAAQIVGLLELPTLLDGENGATPAVRKPLAVYANPTESNPSASVRDARGLLTREVSYEQPSAVVRERRSGWFRIALAGGGSGWVRAEDAGKFHPVAELLSNRLTYLTEHWDGWVWPASGAGHPAKQEKRAAGREQPARITGSEVVGDSLWLQVEVLDGDPCEGGAPNVVHAGWIPAYTPDGELTAWFHSRGC